MVSWTASSSLCTVSLSLLTAALADARLASRVAELMLVLDVEEPVSLLWLSVLLFVLVVVGAVAVFLLGDVVVGAVVVGVVLAGVVLVGAPAAGAVVVPVGPPGEVPLGPAAAAAASP